MEIKLDKITHNNLIENISTTFKPGTIATIVGKNAEGKTSVLDLIYLLKNEYTGSIFVDQDKIDSKTKKSELRKYRKNFFYITSNHKKQFMQITILKDILKLSGTSVSKIKEQTEMFRKFNLPMDILEKSYFELSSGELKKILIISMIISNSSVIIIDEPTSYLDDKSVEVLIAYLKKLKREGKTIILSSTNSEFIYKVTDYIYLLNNKKLSFYQTKTQFLENKTNLDRAGLTIPNALNFRNIVLKQKNIKLLYRDNINDLIKDVYRNAK